MSDHVDGPRTTADPSIDLSDLFAFISPSDPKRLVLIADVFPFAGESAIFSNAVRHEIVLRPVRVTGLGDVAGFQASDPETRFSLVFDVLERDPNGRHLAQKGRCTLPDGGSLDVIVNDEAGTAKADGSVRVFAGLRSDPFFIGWRPDRELIKVSNLLEGDNVLSIVVEFDTARFLDLSSGTLFGVIAETIPRDPAPYIQTVPRFDWIGRPEQTNFRMNMVPDLPDLRDLWNQETPFAISDGTRPLYRQRLIEGFTLWDSRDGKVDWDDKAMAANVNVFLDDFLLIDVARPTTDTSHLEIERSTIEGRPYATGGGRTVNANVIDILVTWLVNRDRGPFMESATRATKPGSDRFPYVSPPNTTRLTLSQSVDLSAPPADVWAAVGQFDGLWMPRVASIDTAGEGIGQIRYVHTLDGRLIVERLEARDDAGMTLVYSLITGMPATDYEGTLQVTPHGGGSTMTWTVRYRPEGVADVGARRIITGMLKVNLASLAEQFGAAP